MPKQLAVCILKTGAQEETPYAQFLEEQGGYWEVLRGYGLNFEEGCQSTRISTKEWVPEYKVVDRLSEPD